MKTVISIDRKRVLNLMTAIGIALNSDMASRLNQSKVTSTERICATNYLLTEIGNYLGISQADVFSNLLKSAAGDEVDRFVSEAFDIAKGMQK